MNELLMTGGETELKRVKKDDLAAELARRNEAASVKQQGVRLAMALAGVVIFGLLVSLTHLADAIHHTTQTPLLLAWAMAVFLDVGMVASEALDVLGVGSYKDKWPTTVYMGAATLISMALNVYSFTLHAEGTLALSIGVGLGVFIPAGIWLLSKGAAKAMKG